MSEPSGRSGPYEHSAPTGVLGAPTSGVGRGRTVETRRGWFGPTVRVTRRGRSQCPTITEQPSNLVMQSCGVRVPTIESQRPCFASRPISKKPVPIAPADSHTSGMKPHDSTSPATPGTRDGAPRRRSITFPIFADLAVDWIAFGSASTTVASPHRTSPCRWSYVRRGDPIATRTSEKSMEQNCEGTAEPAERLSRSGARGS